MRERHSGLHLLAALPALGVALAIAGGTGARSGAADLIVGDWNKSGGVIRVSGGPVSFAGTVVKIPPGARWCAKVGSVEWRITKQGTGYTGTMRWYDAACASKGSIPATWSIDQSGGDLVLNYCFTTPEGTKGCSSATRPKPATPPKPEPPKPSPTPTPPPAGEGTITGTLTDGHGNPLPLAYVRVTYGSNAKTAIADEKGRYKVAGLPTGKVSGFDPAEDAYRVEAWLQLVPDPKQAPLFRIFYGGRGEKTVRAVTKAFVLTPGGVRKDVDFGRTGEFQLNLSEPVPAARLGDAAAVYFHAAQAVSLGARLGSDVLRRFDIAVFDPAAGSAYWEGPVTAPKVWPAGKLERIVITENRAPFGHANRPMNREWHEYGHQFMANLLGEMPNYPGDGNHDGYCLNRSSSDSWTEGFAEFFSVMVGREIAKERAFTRYRAAWGTVELEVDYKAWEDEEFAVAGLLLDLVDGAKDYGGWFKDDPVSVPLATLIDAIRRGASAEPNSNGHIFDVVDLYRNLAVLKVGTGDSDKNGRSDLSDLFVAHGFFENTDGDQTYEAGEKIAFTDHGSTVNAKPCKAVAPRRDAPPLPGSFAAVRTIEPSGKPVSGVTFSIAISFSAPYASRGFAYKAAPGPGGRLYLSLPPGGKATIVASAPGHAPSRPLVVSSEAYWGKVAHKENVPFMSHTFTLVPLAPGAPPKQPTTPPTSGAVRAAVQFTGAGGSLAEAANAPASANGLSVNISPRTGVIANAFWLKDGKWLAKIAVPAGATGLAIRTSSGADPGAPVTRPNAATNFQVVWNAAGVLTSASWSSVGKPLAAIPLAGGQKAIAFTSTPA